MTLNCPQAQTCTKLGTACSGAQQGVRPARRKLERIVNLVPAGYLLACAEKKNAAPFTNGNVPVVCFQLTSKLCGLGQAGLQLSKVLHLQVVQCTPTWALKRDYA